MAKHAARYGWESYIVPAAVRIIMMLLVVILLSQSAIVYIPGMGSRLNTALKIEGKPLNNEELVNLASSIETKPWATLNLKLANYISLPEVTVWVDGKEAGNFQQNEITLSVKQGNVITIKNQNHQLPVTVFVNKKTPNILEPALNSQVTGTGFMYFEPVVLK